MFNTNVLEEKVGYERWVLRECVIAVEKHFGVESEVSTTFHKNGKKTAYIEINEEMGANKRIEVLEKLSPLIFVSSYKVIDMIFEWILEANFKEVPFQFEQKILKYQKNIDKPNFQYPLNLDKDILNCLFAIYDQYRPYRNKIIHGNWGTINKGELKFDFSYKGDKFQKDVPFSDILNLSECVAMFVDELLHPTNKLEIIDTIKYLLDKLAHFHGMQKFNINKPRHFKITYELGDIQNLNVDEIRQYLKEQSLGNHYTFDLIITNGEKRWEFSNHELKDLDFIDVNQSNFDSHII
jgi:hypothetical protein